MGKGKKYPMLRTCRQKGNYKEIILCLQRNQGCVECHVYFQLTSGGTPNKKNASYYENGTIPWVKTGDLKERYVPVGIECITKEGLDNSSAKLFPPKTVLVAMYGATIGACSILAYEAATNQACAAFLPNEDVLPTCLYYFLSSKKEQFMHDGVGGAQPNISAGYLKEVEFSVVPLERNWRWLMKVLIPQLCWGE